MSPSLPVLILSLVAVSPLPSGPTTSAPTRAETAGRAKRGLLPRRSGPSKVVDLRGAAGGRLEVRDVAQPQEMKADAARTPVADPTPTASRASEAEDAPAPAGVEIVREPQRQEGAGKGAGRQDAERAAAAQEEPAQEEERPAQESAADRARDEAVSVSVLTETSIDARGRIIERRMRRDLQLLSVRVLARIDDLPVLSSERLEDGRIRDRVEFAGSTLEVLRDPVGRFVSARAAPGPEEDDDEGETDED